MVVTAFVGSVFLISLVNAVFRKDEVIRGLFALPCAICFSGVFALMTYGEASSSAMVAKPEKAAVESSVATLSPRLDRASFEAGRFVQLYDREMAKR